MDEYNNEDIDVKSLIKNTQEIITLKANIISRVHDIKQTDWSFYNDAKDNLNEYVWTYISPSTKRATPLAYATRSKGVDGVYEIYVNKNIPANTRMPLELHEMGHIIFSHMSLRDSQQDMLIRKILSFWPKIKKSFSDEVLNSTNSHTLANFISNKILNIAMDMEVNSRLFTKNEWVYMKDAADVAYIYACVGSLLSDEKRLNAINTWLDNTAADKGHMFVPIWPEDFGYALGLDYNQYIDLILNQPDDFFKNLKDQLDEQSKNQGTGKSVPGDKNSLDDCDDQEDVGNHKLSKDDIEHMKESYNDSNNEENEEEKKDAEKESDAIDKELDKQNKSNPSKAGSSRAKHVASGYSPVGHSNHKQDIVDISNISELTKIVLNACYNKKKVIHDLDPVYYYNRQKYNSNILIGKYRDKELYRPGNIYIVADCSGSVPMEEVMKMANVVKGIASKCGKKSRLIWWDTELCGDMPLKKIDGPTSSGGTAISKGIKYVNNKYLKKSNDKIIVISDFCDSLNEWNKALKDVKQDCIGLCWREASDANERSVHALEYLYKVDGCSEDSKRTIKNLMDKMNVTIVNI